MLKIGNEKENVMKECGIIKEEIYKMESKILEDRQTPLLLTGTINASVYNNVGNIIQDVSVRLEQYETSIEKYIRETPFDKIVFIENSGFSFNEEKYKDLATEYGKEFEFISGKICKEEVLARGKSFGDAYLVSEALQKSVLLRNVDLFYKISGRIFLKNADKICKTKKIYRNEFIMYQGKGWCFTNIFKVNKEDYLTVLNDVYLDCDEKTRNDIEISFFNRLNSSDLSIGSFHVYPFFDGVMGATGENYSGGLGERIIRNLMARLHFFTKDSLSSKLLAKIWR